ncbi:hypothetical protein JW978_04135 [Candidatus Dojkabacteria bacterium]|nr:hypothetical protein [Candidatus Dojkabacteria bacterium]
MDTSSWVFQDLYGEKDPRDAIALIPALSEVGMVSISTAENEAGHKLFISTHRGDQIAPYVGDEYSRTNAALNDLGHTYSRVFQEEWLEEDTNASMLLDEIALLKAEDVISIIWNSEGQPIGLGILKTLDNEKLYDDLKKFLEQTIEITPEEFRKDLFFQLPELSVYWSELFIASDYRSGLEPFRTLTRDLLRAVTQVRRVNADTHILLTTKGHKPLSEEERRLLTREGITGTDLEKEELAEMFNKHDTYQLDRKGIHPGIYVPYLPKRKLPVMKFAENLKMKRYPVPTVERQDRYIFSIRVGDLLGFAESPNRLLLALKALRLKYLVKQ